MSSENKHIEDILNQYKADLGKHYDTYRNHVYRVFLLSQKMDESHEHIQKYAIAAAFHDLGIWTHNTFDYLEPSISQAEKYVLDNNKNSWVEEITYMIDMHHKRSKYKGDYEKTVETFRRADWIDITKGRMHFELSKDDIKKVTDTYPYIGFHKFLLVQTLKQFLKSPLNPLPMFKK